MLKPSRLMSGKAVISSSSCTFQKCRDTMCTWLAFPDVLPSPVSSWPCFSMLLADMECADVPLLTPSSKEMMSQALKATFSGFAKEQQRLGIPKGKTWLPKNNHGTYGGCVLPGCPEFSLAAFSPVGSAQVVLPFEYQLKLLGCFSWKNVDKSSPLKREAAGTLYQRLVTGRNQEHWRNGWGKVVREVKGFLEIPDRSKSLDEMCPH